MTPQQLHEMTLSGLDLVSQAISIHDRDLRLVAANRKFQTMFDLPDHLVQVGADFRETIVYVSQRGDYGPIDDVEAFADEKVELAKSFQPHYFERTRANGTFISVEGNPMRQGGWVSVYTDITDAKRQEKFIQSHAENLSDELISQTETLAATNREMAATVTALEAAKKDLTHSREELDLINAMTPAHIAHVDADGIYTYSNGKLHTVLPRPNAQIVGRRFSEVVGPPTWDIVSPLFEKVLNGQPSLSEFYDAPSGRHIRLAMTPDVTAGTVEGCYILSMDVTDEVSARTALTHARRRALATQLTSGIAHDFANLLTIIMGQLDQLDDLAHGETKIGMVSATIKSAAQRGADLIESLGQIESPRRFEPVDVDMETFHQTLDRLARAAVPKNVSLGITVSTEDRRLIFDPGFAQDAVLNLVLNASEAMKGEGRVNINFAQRENHKLEIAVSDTGPGFTEEGLANGFTPFYSTKTGKVGKGLGLSAAFDFAKISGGTIRLDNAPSGGACVTIQIPYAPVKSKAAGLVLLVDDDDDVRESVRRLLRRAGHAVIEASSVTEAATLMEVSGLTHIVTDLDVGPTGTGIDVINRAPSHLQCLIITGLPKSDSLRQKAESKHVVLSKPFDFEALESALLRIEQC